MTEQTPQPQEIASEVRGEWVKPEIASFLPAKAAEGISYRPTDGLSNLTP
ncbi:hypothetical protein [Sphingomonas sp.]|jgi:hypothetical protein|nr:hypothetical protein [Sphingomonas sp.]MDK2766915.1 hypothetical protein [Sphingomonas sp.]